MTIRENHAFRSFNVCLANFNKFGISLPELVNYMLIIKTKNKYTYFFDTQAHTISTF